jgi:hypothetical protein
LKIELCYATRSLAQGSSGWQDNATNMQQDIGLQADKSYGRTFVNALKIAVSLWMANTRDLWYSCEERNDDVD